VETGTPKAVISERTPPAAVDAENPWYGRIRVILLAILSMTRHPPNSVPSDMARDDAKMTQSGT
jgi:hypothetical protein